MTGATGPITAECVGGSLNLGGTAVDMPNSGSNATINVPQLPFGVPLVGIGAGGTVIDTTFNAPAAHALVIVGGTYTGTTTFNVEQGHDNRSHWRTNRHVLGNAKRLRSRNGRVTSGTLQVGVGGLTLDFTGNMFQWTGGEINGSRGT